MFAVIAINPKHKTFIVHVVSLSFIIFLSSTSLNTDIHLFYRPQIASMIAKKALTKVSNNYVNFADVFFPDLTFELSEHTGNNDHGIIQVHG